ncbi:MAG: RNA pseudouridine synthase [Candidatus Magasanikbacteria bacterium]
MVEVLYEDNHLIAVWKPAGMLVQGDETGDTCLMDEVKQYLKEKYNKPGNVFLGLLHRLDRPVSGIVLFAKTSKGASRLSEQIRNHTVKKVYHALVTGNPPKKGTLVHYILKDEKKNTVTVFDEPKKEALRAELEYTVLETDEKHSLVEVHLITGRPHQIRAQFSHIGHPLLGDTKYGSREKYAHGDIALSAVELGFETATTQEWKVIQKDISL